MKKISVLKQINKRIIAMSMLLVLMIQCMEWQKGLII